MQFILGFYYFCVKINQTYGGVSPTSAMALKLTIGANK